MTNPGGCPLETLDDIGERRRVRPACLLWKAKFGIIGQAGRIVDPVGDLNNRRVGLACPVVAQDTVG